MKDLPRILWSFYGRPEKQSLAALFLLTLALAGLEMIGAGAFFAYTSILADNNIIYVSEHSIGRRSRSF